MSPPILLLVVAALWQAPEAADPVPRRQLRVTLNLVGSGSEAPGSFLEDLQPVLASKLVERGCLGVGEADPGASRPADLELRIAFEGFHDEVAFGASIAERSAPGGVPELQRQLAAVVEAEFLVELRLPGPDGAVVRAERYRRQVSYGPAPDEDPRLEARHRMAGLVAQAVQRFSCDGSEKRFQRELARAREASVP